MSPQSNTKVLYFNCVAWQQCDWGYPVWGDLCLTTMWQRLILGCGEVPSGWRWRCSALTAGGITPEAQVVLRIKLPINVYFKNAIFTFCPPVNIPYFKRNKKKIPTYCKKGGKVDLLGDCYMTSNTSTRCIESTWIYSNVKHMLLTCLMSKSGLCANKQQNRQFSK